MPDPKKVVITSLTVRFYEAHGWRIDDFLEYLGPEDKMYKFPDLLNAYFIPMPGSWSLNIRKMYEDGLIGEVLGKDEWGETKGLSDFEALLTRQH